MFCFSKCLWLGVITGVHCCLFLPPNAAEECLRSLQGLAMVAITYKGSLLFGMGRLYRVSKYGLVGCNAIGALLVFLGDRFVA